MLSLSNWINTRTRTKLSEVRNVTIFSVQLCPHAGAKGSDLSPGMLVPLTQPREGPLTVNERVSTAVVFLLRPESHYNLKHFVRGISSHKF